MADPTGGAEALATPERGILTSCGHFRIGPDGGAWPGLDTTCSDAGHSQAGGNRFKTIPTKVAATNITQRDAEALVRMVRSGETVAMLQDGRIVDRKVFATHCPLHGNMCTGAHFYEAIVPRPAPDPNDITFRLQMTTRGDPTDKVEALLHEAAQTITNLRSSGDELAAALDAAIERENHPLVHAPTKFDTYIASAEALDAISSAIARLNAIFTMESGVDIDLSGGIPIEYEGTLIGRLVKVGHVIALDVRQG